MARAGLAYYSVVYYFVAYLSAVPRTSLLTLYFIESKVFSKRIGALGLEEQLRTLQDELLANPTVGRTDPSTGGLRKARMPDPDRRKGKRGGARVHYLYLARHEVVYLLFVYGKGEQERLTPRQKKELKAMVDVIKSEWGE